MKVLHFDTGREWRGGQRQALFLHEELLKLGVESNIVCERGGELLKRGNFIPFSWRSEVSISTVFEFLKIIKEYDPDVIHSHGAHTVTPLLFTKIFNGKPKFVATRRTDYSVKKPVLGALKYDNRHLDSLVAISQGVKDILTNDGIHPDKIEVIHSGVRLCDQSFDAKAVRLELGVSEDEVLIGTTQNLSPHKDHYTMLRAFNEACDASSNIRLIVVGDGPLLDDVRSFAAGLKCFDKVILTGFREDVHRILSALDIYMVSSNKEGLNTSVIDAMSMSLPIIATDIGGLPELVGDGENGLLGDVEDFYTLGEHIKTMSRNIELRQEMGKKGREKASFFSAEAMGMKYLELYRRLVKL